MQKSTNIRVQFRLRPEDVIWVNTTANQLRILPSHLISKLISQAKVRYKTLNKLTIASIGNENE